MWFGLYMGSLTFFVPDLVTENFFKVFETKTKDKQARLKESGMNGCLKSICFYWKFMFSLLIYVYNLLTVYRTRACCFMGSMCCMPSWPFNSLSWCEGSMDPCNPFNGVPCVFMFAYVAWSWA